MLLMLLFVVLHVSVFFFFFFFFVFFLVVVGFSLSSSWCRELAAVCDCGTPWTFLLTFLQLMNG